MSDKVCKSLSGEVLCWREARVGVTSLTTRQHAPMLQHHLASAWPRLSPWTSRLLYLPMQVEKWGARMYSGLYCCVRMLSCWADAATLGCMSFLAHVTLTQVFCTIFHYYLPLPWYVLLCIRTVLHPSLLEFSPTTFTWELERLLRLAKENMQVVYEMSKW